MEALQRLIEGNARFVSGKLKQTKREPVAEHKPFAAILTCADARVVPEVIFDQGVGDLFCVEVAGNVIDPVVQESLNFAISGLNVELVVVMGHAKCAAVKAAMDGVAGLEEIVRIIKPSVADTLEQSIKNNAIAMSQKVKGVAVKAAYYCVETGKVEFL